MNKLEQVSPTKPSVVQQYISNPYLINGCKFDLRVYVYVTSFNPLRVYVYKDGLTRFASRKFLPLYWFKLKLNFIIKIFKKKTKILEFKPNS